MQVPSHPDILYLGFLGDEEKFRRARRAEVLVMPSFYESLSMVTLEAGPWGNPSWPNALSMCSRASAGVQTAGFIMKTTPSSGRR